MLKFLEYMLLAGFVAVLVVASYWIGQQAYSWMPPQATAEAQRVDDLFSFLTSIGAFIFLGLVGMMVYSVIFYRASPEDYSEGDPARSSVKLEILWMVAPTLLVLWIAAQNINIYNQLNVLGLKQVVQLPLETEPAYAAASDDKPKPAAEQIEVIAKQWVWSFRYPNNVTSHELHLPVNQRTQLDLKAEDVLHGFYVPEFRLKQDIVPRRSIALVVTPTRVGKYRLRDSQFSGTDFASMEADVYVESREAYSRWLAEAAPTKNSDILTAPLNQSTIGRRDINVDEGAVKMSGFVVTPQPMLTANSTVEQQSSKTWFKSGWYTGVPTQSHASESFK